MSAPDFNVAFNKLLEHEGYLSNHAKDPGGLTKFGISQAAYPAEDIQNLNLNRAAEIYMRDYWTPLGCYNLPEPIAFALFDAAVNSGLVPATRWLQMSLKDVKVDGIMGPETINAARLADPSKTVARMHGYRLEFMTSLGTWETFGKGWTRRIAHNLQEV